jgi:hypothetical protein
MSAYCPHGSTPNWYNISIGDLVDPTPEALVWASGFVIGSEPNSPLDPEGYELEPGSPEYEAWDAARESYRATGVWPLGVPRRI